MMVGLALSIMAKLFMCQFLIDKIFKNFFGVGHVRVGEVPHYVNSILRKLVN